MSWERPSIYGSCEAEEASPDRAETAYDQHCLIDKSCKLEEIEKRMAETMINKLIFQKEYYFSSEWTV